MYINHNMKTDFISRNLKTIEYSSDKVHEKLSSAKKINRAGDDSSGLAISEKMNSQIRGLFMAGKNAQDDISLLQSADGYLEDVTALIQRIRELAVQASNGILTEYDREIVGLETDKLLKAVDKVIEYAEFNQLKIFNNMNFRFHIGANMDQYEELFIEKIDTKYLGIDNLKMDNQENSNQAIGKLDVALREINRIRAKIGSISNRLEKAYNGIMTNRENTIYSQSRILDTDMAFEFSEYLKHNILTEANSLTLVNVHKMNNYLLNNLIKV